MMDNKKIIVDLETLKTPTSDSHKMLCDTTIPMIAYEFTVNEDDPNKVNISLYDVSNTPLDNLYVKLTEDVTVCFSDIITTNQFILERSMETLQVPMLFKYVLAENLFHFWQRLRIIPSISEDENIGYITSVHLVLNWIQHFSLLKNEIEFLNAIKQGIKKL
jgi:hypothetical protein